MTEEELREKIVKLLRDYWDGCVYTDTKRYANQILTLIREAGWKSPEEVKEMNDIILFGPKSLR